VPARPTTDPGFDRAILEPLVRNHDRALRDGDQRGAARAAAEITEAARGQLSATWQSAWNAIALLNALPQTASAQTAGGLMTGTRSPVSAATWPTAASHSRAVTVQFMQRPGSTS
jgi:hypothetical protein